MANKGKFINTTHSDNISKLVQTAKDIIKNPYYLWSNKTATIVTYYNINTEMTTLDEGFKNIIAETGKDSSVWYNVIKNFYLYGIEQIQIQMENGEFGAEAGEITGEAILLPNTIIPYQGDYFKIDYIKESFMFRINGVSHDTLENGANLYKINYKLETRDHHDFNIKDHYTLITNNVGTSFNTILRDEKVDLIEELESFLYNLKTYFTTIFYNDRVQAFIYKYKGMRFYDPYMTEFLINNKILSGGEEYIYIAHQIPLRNHFPITYNKSFFTCLEKKDFKHIRRYNHIAISKYIDALDTTIFSTREEDYLEVDWRFRDDEKSLYGILPCFPDRLIEHIESRKLFEGDDSIYNVIVKYAISETLTFQDVDILNFDEHNNLKLFYTIPAIIYCLESYIKHMMKEN